MDGSLPIRAMTARDELMLKSPDALLNGDSLVHIISSCVPDIIDPKKVYAPDIEAIILGIFFASYGKTIDFKRKVIELMHKKGYALDTPKIPPTDTTIKELKELNLKELNASASATNNPIAWEKKKENLTSKPFKVIVTDSWLFEPPKRLTY